MVWGWWGAWLSYVMEFFPSAIFWNVMKSWHAVQITYFCTHLKTFFFVSELCLGHSLVTLNFRQLQSERAVGLCPSPCIVRGGCSCPLRNACVWDTNGTKQSRTVPFCIWIRLPFSLVLLISCQIRVLVICICGATWKCLSYLSVHLFVTREKFTCSLKVTCFLSSYQTHVTGMAFKYHLDWKVRHRVFI